MTFLSPRLKYISELVLLVDKICDIGCDHGYISTDLLKKKKVNYVIATDISEPSLNKAKHLLSSMFAEDKFEIRLGDGFQVINKNEVDAAIIAGMGGDLIKTILENDWEKVVNLKYIILQPMQKRRDLFEWLAESGFKFEDCRIAKESRRYYPIVRVKFNDQKMNFSPEIFEKSIYYKELLANKLFHYRQIAENIKAYSSDKNSYTKVLKEIEFWEEYYDKA